MIANGNLTAVSDGSSTTRYIYNAENRLVASEPVNPKDNDTRITFTYDYMGRRVEKKTFVFSENDWQAASTQLPCS